MSSAKASWGKEIVVEDIGGVPFRMYSDRLRRVEELLSLGKLKPTRT